MKDITSAKPQKTSNRSLEFHVKLLEQSSRNVPVDNIVEIPREILAENSRKTAEDVFEGSLLESP